MKKLLIRIGLLALALLVVVLLHSRVKQEAEQAAQTTTGMEGQAEPSVQSMAVMRVDDGGVTLGRMEESNGGVQITVPKDDGTEAVYTFRDVAIDSWYADAVNFVVSAGLMTGVGDEPYFQPEYGMLRESFAAILYRYADGEPVEPKYRFDDVDEDKWYYGMISWVVNERLMTGLTDPSGSVTFGVGEYMTCEQALIGLYRLAGEPETDGSLADYPYAAKVSESGRSAVDWAWKNGLITEVECVWYPPQAISRAQVALLLMRYSAMTP